MKPNAKKKMGKIARQFVIDNFSIETVGKQFEDLFDSFEEVDWDNISIGDFKERDPQYKPDNKLDHIDWLIDLYKNCLPIEVDAEDSGLKY